MKIIAKCLTTTSLIGTLLITGCASIIDGGTKTVTIKSTPTGAKVTVVNEKTKEAVASGVTPAALVLKRDNGFFQNASYRVSIEKDGHKPYELLVQSTLNGWYFGNLLFGGLIGMIIVDPATGAMWTFQPSEYNATLVTAGSTSIKPELRILLKEDLTSEQSAQLVPLAAAQR